jgi:acetyl esterase/lipase
VDIDARTDDTHRQILGFLPPDLFDLSDLAVGIERLMSLLGAPPPDLPSSVAVTDHHATAADGHQVLVRVHRPAERAGAIPCLYWIHGGGLVLGSVAMDDARCAELVDALGIAVASVEYRLAPAHPYPTPLDDCATGYEWLVSSCDALGLDPSRIAIGGGSAGGGLAAALALRLRDAGGHQPCFQLLRYPMIDDRNVTGSSHAVTDLRVWNRSSNLVGWGAYLGDALGTDGVPAYAAAARATDLAGLPPAIVTVGELDLFLDEDLDYARRLIAAGVATEVHVYGACIHGSDALVPHAEAVQRWKRDEMDALRRAFA